MIENRIKGGLYGVFIGDALGVPHEFKGSTGYTGILYKRNIHRSIKLAVGQISDDSEMMITMLNSIIKHKNYKVKKVIKEYIEWANSGTYMLGRNTRELLKNRKGYIQAYTDKFGLDPFKPFEKSNFLGEKCQSNGSLMRAFPLCFVEINKIMEDVWLTNPSFFVLECEHIYIRCLKKALKGYSCNQIWNYVKNKSKSEILNEIIDDIENDNYRNIDINKGWVGNSFYCAMLSLKLITKNWSYSEIINYVIRLGGDTDTNAAISGGLIGMIIGYSNFDEITLRNCEIIDRYMNDENESDLFRPDKYKIKNLDETVHKILSILF